MYFHVYKTQKKIQEMAKQDFYTVEMASAESKFSERYIRDKIGEGKLKSTERHLDCATTKLRPAEPPVT